MFKAGVSNKDKIINFYGLDAISNYDIKQFYIGLGHTTDWGNFPPEKTDAVINNLEILIPHNFKSFIKEDRKGHLVTSDRRRWMDTKEIVNQFIVQFVVKFDHYINTEYYNQIGIFTNVDNISNKKYLIAGTDFEVSDYEPFLVDNITSIYKNEGTRDLINISIDIE